MERISASIAEAASHERLRSRLNTLLPPMYRDTYESLTPVSMGSAGLRFDAEGRVAWDRMWGSFCNLAIAGGPPHKGRLLEAPTPAEVQSHPDRQAEVVQEIARGINLVTGMTVTAGAPGWVRVHCANDAMAAWMLRAITMENVAVRGMGTDLELPAGPLFRLEKEIKNVITVTAKAAHYWEDHMPRESRIAVARLLLRMDAEQALLNPAFVPHPRVPLDVLRTRVGAEVTRRSGLDVSGTSYSGWLGFACETVQAAVATMRLVVVSNVLARREDTVLYLPLHASLDPRGEIAAEAVRQAREYLVAKGEVEP